MRKKKVCNVIMAPMLESKQYKLRTCEQSKVQNQYNNMVK